MSAPTPLQDAGRRVAFYTLSHVLGLDLQFHLNRKTGGWQWDCKKERWR